MKPWILGTHDAVTPDDYPDRAADLAAALTEGRAERGILICGSGVGASVAANKVRGIRAAFATTPTPRTRAWSTTR